MLQEKGINFAQKGMNQGQKGMNSEQKGIKMVFTKKDYQFLSHNEVVQFLSFFLR